ncbi:MAG: HD-GYP domain-containing protein [Treponema sp.]|nr:HD-GYP domain-containing protein [Treponema sp.]
MKKLKRTVMTGELVEGSVYSEDVYIDGDNLFVPAGVAIRGKDIKRLVSLGIGAVETAGDIVTGSSSPEPMKKAPEPPPEKTAAKPAPKSAPEPRTTLKEIRDSKGPDNVYLDIVNEIGELCKRIEINAPIKAGDINDIAERLLQAVRNQRASFIGFILGENVKGHNLAKSSVNTAILSALIAIELKLKNHKVLQVVTGALLHDVGMLRMPKEIVEKRGGLSSAELQRIQAHTLHTYKIVNKELRYPDEIGAIVLQHHERWDGEGYPRQLSGQSIDIGARIVSVADAFEAMVSQKPYRNSMIGYQAMKNLLSDNLRRFDPDVVKAFIQTMGIYPIGSIILLNNGAIARVVNVQATAPLRPTIRILVDETGKVLKKDEGKLIDLLAEKRLFISRAVDPKEITGRNAG